MEKPSLTVHVTDKQLTALAAGIRISEIRAALPELEAKCNAKIEVAEDFGNLVKLVALKSSVDPAVLSAYVTAICTDTLRKKQHKAEQLSLLFSELA